MFGRKQRTIDELNSRIVEQAREIRDLRREQPQPQALLKTLSELTSSLQIALKDVIDNNKVLRKRLSKKENDFLNTLLELRRLMMSGHKDRLDKAHKIIAMNIEFYESMNEKENELDRPLHQI